MSDERKPKEKQQSRAGNVEVTEEIVSRNYSPQEMGESLDDLVQRARQGIQHELNITANPKYKYAAKDLIMLVMDGSSPLAALVPPEQHFTGKKMVLVRVWLRSGLMSASVKIADQLREILSQPSPCGHLQYLVSTSFGGAIECVTCGLNMKATYSEPS